VDVVGVVLGVVELDQERGPLHLVGVLLVAVCGVFFAIGYSLGKTSAREQAVNDKTSLSASLAAPAVPESSVVKPSAVVSGKADSRPGSSEDSSAAKSAPDMTFYSAVKKDDHGAHPADLAVASSAAKTPQEVQTVDTASVKVAPLEANPAKSAADAKVDTKAAVIPVGGGAFVVQIAAVSREEDAAALAGALRKKSYSVFVVNNPAVHDKLYHVQVGPFATLQDAEAMKLKLTGEGYNPIVKRT
jgi:cell division septation protein DedD